MQWTQEQQPIIHSTADKLITWTNGFEPMRLTNSR